MVSMLPSQMPVGCGIAVTNLISMLTQRKLKKLEVLKPLLMSLLPWQPSEKTDSSQ